jgi:hypothetical protein
MKEEVEPIRRSVTVGCDADRAFTVFTDQIGTWWPIETHSRAAVDFEGGGVKAERVEFQGRIGGQVFEHMSNGQALPWAEVVAWDPPDSSWPGGRTRGRNRRRRCR